MKRFYNLLFVAVIGLTTISSCSEFFWDCLDGNGRSSSVRRVVGDFSSVTSYGNFVVNVSKGDTKSVSVEADENLLPYIETNIRGNTLILETTDNRCIKSSNQIFIDIVTPEIYELKMAGSGVIYCDDVITDDLKYVLEGSGEIKSSGIIVDNIQAILSGSGEISIEGTALQTDFMISGSGNIRTLNLETDNCIATITGSGNIYTYVNDLLNVLISGSGNVVYKGDPEKTVTITGSGRVIRY